MKISQILRLLLMGFIVIGFLGQCSEQQSPTEVTTHPSVWNDQSSSIFHGDVVMEEGDLELCMSCHGSRLDTEGRSGVACIDCHNGNAIESVQNHTNRIREANWDMSSCQLCHTSDYTGMAGSANCADSNCHAREEGPESCNTCHGDFSANYTNVDLTDGDIAPPADLEGNTRQKDLGVGLHQFHLLYWPTCEDCHVPVDSFDDPNHIDGDDIAELNTDIDKGIKVLTWDREEATCTASCHIEDGQAVAKKWTIP